MEVPGGATVPDRTCDVCGARTAASFRFCGACGHRLVAPSADETDGTPPPPPPQVGRDRPDGPAVPVSRPRLLTALVAALALLAGTLVVSRLGPGPVPPLQAAGRGDAGRTGTFPAVADAELPGAVVWRDTWTTAPPDRRLTPRRPVAVAAGYLMPTTGGLALLDRRDGHVRWRAELDVAAAVDPLPVDDRLVAVAEDGAVSLLDSVDGTRLWRTSLPDLGAPRSLAATARTLAVTGSSGAVVLVDLARGTVRAELSGRELLGGLGPFSADAVVAADERLVVVVRRTAEERGRLAGITPDGDLAWVSSQPVSAHLPLLAAGGVVVATDASEGVVGVRASDGTVAWRWRLAADERPGEVAAVATSRDGARVLLASASGVRRTLGTASGLLLVSENGAPLPVTGVGPTDARDRVAATTPGGVVEVVEVDTGRVVALGPTTGSGVAVPLADGDHLVTALAGGQVVAEPLGLGGSSWASRVTPVAACTAVGAGEAVLIADGSGVRAHDARTGARRWTATPEGGTTGELVAADDLVLAVAPTGLVTALDGTDGRTRWVASAGGAPLGSPVVVGDTAVLAGGPEVGLAGGSRAGYLRALDLADGSRRWFVNTVGPLAQAPTVVGDRLVVATTTGELEAVDLATGAERWRTELDAPAISPPVQRGRAIVVVDGDGALTTYLDDGDGPRAVARTTFDLPLRRIPVVTDDTIVVRADSQRLVALDLETHRVRWESVAPGDVLTTPPTVVGDVVLVGGQRGVHGAQLVGGAPLARADVGAVVGTLTATDHGAVACRADGVVIALR